jgi:hypothetical protein
MRAAPAASAVVERHHLSFQWLCFRDFRIHRKNIIEHWPQVFGFVWYFSMAVEAFRRLSAFFLEWVCFRDIASSRKKLLSICGEDLASFGNPR